MSMMTTGLTCKNGGGLSWEERKVKARSWRAVAERSGDTAFEMQRRVFSGMKRDRENQIILPVGSLFRPPARLSSPASESGVDAPLCHRTPRSRSAVRTPFAKL